VDRSELLREGAISKLKKRLAELETKIKRHTEEIAYQSFAGQGIERIDAEAALQAAQELKKAKDEWLEIKARIREREG